jgi:hypothetical protein
VRVVDLAAPASDALADLACTLFTFVSAPPAGTDASRLSAADVAAWAWPLAPRGGGAGRVAIVSSATSAGMLSPYGATLRNHAGYAKSHGYACVLALVPPSALGGRSPKMAKHYAMATLAAGAMGTWDVLLHLDMDAWFASWAPLEEVTAGWPADKELLLPDAGQLWLNSGLLIARGAAPWSARFFAAVLDARHAGAEAGADGDEAGAGFKRDQPAVWSVLASAWRDAGALPAYEGRACGAWADACNPDANPVECWHWCFWEPFIRAPSGWAGLRSLDAMPHVHVPARHAAGGPPLHRLCLASCPSALARAPGLLCALAHGGSKAATAEGGACGPRVGHDKMSQCDGRGCLRQLAAGGGAWVKHSGHQHWRDVLPRCVPANAEQAAARLTSVADCV